MRLPAADLEHVLEHAAPAFEALRGARLFITGGTGFFGTWLLETLAHADDALGLGVDAVVLTRDPAAFAARAPHLASHRALSFHAGDVRSFAFPSGAFSHVIHAATPASAALNAARPREMVDTIVEGTARTLDLAVSAGVRRLLLVSSGAVYGPQPPSLERVDEEFRGGPDPLDSGSAYGEGKRLAELLCAITARELGIEIPVARAFAFVGPHLPLDAHFAIGNFIRDALLGRSIEVSGDGSPYRSYLYAADLAAWLWVILAFGTTGRAYNVGSPCPVTIRQAAHVVASAVGGMAVSVSHPIDPARLPSRYVPAVDRAETELGLRAWVTLDDAVKRTLAWHRAAQTLLQQTITRRAGS